METRVCTECNKDLEICYFRQKIINEHIRYESKCKKCTYQVSKRNVNIMKNDNPDKYMKLIEGRKNRDKKYYEINKKKVNNKNNIYYQKNKINIQATRRNFRKKNPERVKNWKNSYKDSIEGKLAINYRRRIRREIDSGKEWLELLGCTINQLKNWFEYNFDLDYQHGFTWENYGSVWTIDHVMPCNSFDMTNSVEVKKCFNWTNTIPVTKKYNEEKNNKIIKNDILKLELRLRLFKNRFKYQSTTN